MAADHAALFELIIFVFTFGKTETGLSFQKRETCDPFLRGGSSFDFNK